MDADEIRRKLREAGIQVGSGWQATNQLNEVSSPIVERQKAALRKIEGMLVQQLEADQQKMAELVSTLQRLKHGGGLSNG